MTIFLYPFQMYSFFPRPPNYGGLYLDNRYAGPKFITNARKMGRPFESRSKKFCYF